MVSTGYFGLHVQMGTLGAGNHYAEIQVVEEVFDKAAARKMGIDKVGQVCIMIHSGSRGLGHQVTVPQTIFQLGVHMIPAQSGLAERCMISLALHFWSSNSFGLHPICYIYKT